MIARALAAVAAATLLLAPVAIANDYSDTAYLQFDADNIARTLQRQTYQVTTPEYLLAAADTFPGSWLAGWQRQAREAGEGRLYVTGGSVLPGGNVGDPETYRANEAHRTEVEYLDRDGARIIGNVWPCDGGAAPCPGVVVTTGSIQVTQHMYDWLARALQLDGYTVFTFDVRGQGQSEQTTQNPQDEANFVNGTIDALRFFLSDANPLRATVDETRLALVGHSLGARAVSVVQQCSTSYPGTDASACGGETWPILAVVAYDSLSGDVTPVVPAFDHRADGYFINAVPTPTAPDPDEHVDAAYRTWRDAGVDACTITVRGGTHAEWSDIPGIVSATRYGSLQSAYYTAAFLDTYVKSDDAAFAALQDGPRAVGGEPWSATLFSGKYRSACHVRGWDAPDLRAYAGVAAVGDWAALNSES
ncbi:MAG TPA: alpha/beta fold hydrolase [Acidimicrobiales bacterium]|nr:alpha/beta fold hydrolase [Acidimicrobiales bacterium]